MEERKTVEIVDEHGINRKANIMCGIDVAGTDYVVYSIERDTDNDNLFVSKLIKNNDGTNNMINIDDNSEKTKLADIVKEMITQAVNNESDKLTGDVTLSSGDKVQVINVLINKEQKISVPKTYITTVKKSVTKVGNDFFKVSEGMPVVESIFGDAIPAQSESPVVDAVLPDAPVAPEVTIPDELSVVEPIEPVAAPVAPEPVIPAAPAVEPILPDAYPVEPVTPAPVVEPVVAPVTPEPVIPAAPAVEPILPDASPAEPVTPAPVDQNGVFFDASAESNLNAALHEASDDSAISVPNVEPIREFGVDTPSATIPETPQDTGDNPPQTSGFANNKFFMVVAIVFFLASCVFLGYEVFRYIKLVG